MEAIRPSPAAPRREQCIACAYPLDADGDIFSVLSRLKGMMSHVGYTVDRFLVEESRDAVGTKSVTLELRPSSSLKRSRPASPDRFSNDPASKRIAIPGCKLCASSCCSTNSLCKANICGHRGEEESNPTPPSPEGHRHHSHAWKGLPHPHGHTHPVAGPRQQRSHHRYHGPTAQPLPIVADHELEVAHPSAVHGRNDGKAVAASHYHARTRFRMSDIDHHLSESRAPEPVVKDAQRKKPPHIDRHQNLLEPTRSVDHIRNAGAEPEAPTPEKEADTGWTATTAHVGASFDATHMQRLGSVAFPMDRISSKAVAATTRQTGSMTGAAGHQRSSPISRLTSPELHREGFDIGARGREDVAKDGARDAVVTRGAYCELLRSPPELMCRACELNFSAELELRKHQFMKHKDEKIGKRTSEGRFLCLMHSCAQSFVRRHVMERHFKSVHLLVRDFPCSRCDKSFADSSTREAHRTAVHEKQKPYICDQCSSCFTQSSSLGKHRRRFHRGTVSGVQTKR